MTDKKDFYFTIESHVRSPELKVKGSRFIADIFPAVSKSEIDEKLSAIRKEFYDATHHCYAFILGVDGKATRAADDGEPAGTAGKPILQALTSKELTDSLLIVTRYYGGTNLGTGGLSRAYSEAAQLCVSEATIRTVFLTDSLDLKVHYEDLAPLERLLARLGANISYSNYTDVIQIRVNIRKTLSNTLKDEIAEKFYGRVEAADVGSPKTES